MFHRILFGILGCGLLLALASWTPAVHGQKNPPKEVDQAALRKAAYFRAKTRADEEYQTFFKEPKTAIEFWAAINFEIQTGKFDVAGYHLEKMLKVDPKDADPELLLIEEAEGISAFLRLQTVKKWFDNPELQKEAEGNVQALIERVTGTLEKHLADPARIRKFIANLNGDTVQKRTYALVQLKRVRERATPYLVEELRKTAGSFEHQRIKDAMVELDKDIVPPFLEVLKARDAKDARDPDLRLALLDVLKRRVDRRCIPYLWHLSASPKYPDLVRLRAKELLAFFLEVDVAQLPSAKVALTELSERYYQHRVRFADPDRVRIWLWDGKQIDPKAVVIKASQAEEYFGLRHAKEALELDAAYRPAQIAYLSLMLERNLNDRLEHLFIPSTKADVQQPITSISQMLKTVDADLLMVVLERALGDHNLAVALPIIQTLGERGETRAAEATPNGNGGALIRALYYPDRRVQFAAVTALLNLPVDKVPAAAPRVVDVLRRFAATGPRPKALVLFVNDERAAELRKVLGEAGYDATIVPTLGTIPLTLKEARERVRESAGYDAILVNSTVPEYELSGVLAQLRGDADLGTVPILLLAPAKRRVELARFAEKRRNVKVLPEAFTVKAADLKQELDTAVKYVMQPDTFFQAPIEQRIWLDADFRKSGLQQLAAERTFFAKQALDALRRMAVGELPGYDVRQAESAVVAALRGDDTAYSALEILARFPGKAAQSRLAEVVLDPTRKALRIKAAVELNRHVKQHGVLLPADKALDLRTLFASPKTDPILREQLAVLVGNLRPTMTQTGQRLLGFDPLAPLPK